MRNYSKFGGGRHAWLLALALPLAGIPAAVQVRAQSVQTVVAGALTVQGAQVINPTTVDIRFSDGSRMTVDFYGDRVLRLFQDKNGGIVRDPQASPEARILADCPRRQLSAPVRVEDAGGALAVVTEKVRLEFDRKTTCFRLVDRATGRTVTESRRPVEFGKKKVALALREDAGEYFYGGGVQNGRFSHKGKTIAIENTNNWTDGGVASPTPFYWSTCGYGVMWHTFAKGRYDFGASEPGTVVLSHDTDYLDLFLMVDEGAVPLLNDFYQLTGHPVLLPKFGFYEGHLNAYNRDYWKETEEGGVLFEDGKRYKESQTDNGGIKESLNGEKNNYQFSARAVIDRYNAHDMPLGWVLPNDGYGAGYGQTSTLDGNIENLKAFGEYARAKGVEIGLWTQSDLHPKKGVEALLQRDIVKEVRDAGVRVLKTDVAWVGAGYSFGLNGVADVGEIMPYYGNDARPFIISLDGWGGTQRYAAIWSGDQTGGEWEYIRFHIPTYIGSGLSGQPNITSDMDGIFGGKNPVVNIRDFQWKTFSPMQLNMDGWGYNEKYPHALGEPAASINRNYLKLKSELLPYAYTYAREAVDGKPLIRAMMLEYPNAYTLGPATGYQYLYGPDFLVAPIYQATAPDSVGNDIRNGIYLPEGTWIDYFSGDSYEGGRIINNFPAPIWKLPVFVKAGAIIPMVNPNNNVSGIRKDLRIYELYPYGNTSMTEYDDDGTTEAYRRGEAVETRIDSRLSAGGDAMVTVSPSTGSFAGYQPVKATEFIFNVTQPPKAVEAKVGGRKVKLTPVSDMAAFEAGENVYWYDAAPDLNRFATPGSEFASVKMTKNPQLRVKIGKVDTSTQGIEVTVKGYKFAPADKLLVSSGALAAPVVTVADENVGPYTVEPHWSKVDGANYYEIEHDGMLYSTIRDNYLLFEGLRHDTDYKFRIRSVNRDGHSDWSEFNVRTKANPLEFAIRDIKASSTAEDQAGFGIARLVDFAEGGDIWHTRYRKTAVPFSIILDLQSVNTLDRFDYLPRMNGGNGTLLRGFVSYGMDGEEWTPVDSFVWKRNADVKSFAFPGKPSARYIKIDVTEGVGNYGSGSELYVFKVPGTESYIPGDVNADGRIDANDLMSYTNYTGLRHGDSDFEGYISNGDVNRNGLIDAYDISLVATRLDGGADASADSVGIGGKLRFNMPRRAVKAGDEVVITVTGDSMQAVNALSFAMPYDAADFEFIGIDAPGLAEMDNLTNDRRHTDGSKALYPTFVNVGNRKSVYGSQPVMTIRFKARRNATPAFRVTDGILVDKSLHTVHF